MATILEYYKTDFDVQLRLDSQQSASTVDGVEQKFDASCLLDFVSNAKYLAFYFPRETNDGRLFLHLLQEFEAFFNEASNIQIGKRVPADFMGEIKDMGYHKVALNFKLPGDLIETKIDEMNFTRRIFYYHVNNITQDSLERLYGFARSKGLALICRGPDYAKERDHMEKPRAFISHDSRDKETIARPLATRLRNMHCPVWYDEFSLTVGVSLRESIESGLKECHMCVLLLTPNFLSKGGWPKREYDTIFTRELVEERNLILPVWAGVSRDDVYKYSPILADRVALHWELGEDEVCRRLASKLMP